MNLEERFERDAGGPVGDLIERWNEPHRRYHDAAAVRAEYAQFPDDQFAAGRRYVLTRLLASPLCRTPQAANAWTERAKANLRAEIDRLA